MFIVYYGKLANLQINIFLALNEKKVWLLNINYVTLTSTASVPMANEMFLNIKIDRADVASFRSKSERCLMNIKQQTFAIARLVNSPPSRAALLRPHSSNWDSLSLHPFLCI